MLFSAGTGQHLACDAAAVSEPAASLFGARLHVGGRLPAPLIVPLIFVRNAVLGWWGVETDRVAPASVEIFKLSDDSCVRAIPVGTSYYEQGEQLEMVRRALKSQTVEDFSSAWIAVDG